MVKSKRIYNLKKDTWDHRDYLLQAPHPKSGLIPKEWDNRKYCSPVRNQGDLGSCSAFSSAGGAFEMLEIKELMDNQYAEPIAEEFGPKFEPVSTLMQYQNTLIIENAFGTDQGAEIRDAIKALATYGVCKESTWPYDISKFGVKPTDEAYQEAALHKITMYERVLGMSAIRHAVAQCKPVVCGIQVYESMESEEVARSGMVPMPNTDLELHMGGHAVCVVGYTPDHWIMRNSWGPDWGLKGYFFLPLSYLIDTNLSLDFWAITK